MLNLRCSATCALYEVSGYQVTLVFHIYGALPYFSITHENNVDHSASKLKLFWVRRNLGRHTWQEALKKDNLPLNSEEHVRVLPHLIQRLLFWTFKFHSYKNFITAFEPKAKSSLFRKEDKEEEEEEEGVGARQLARKKKQRLTGLQT